MADRRVLSRAQQLALATCLVAVGVTWRLLRDDLGLPPNLEPITAVAFVLALCAAPSAAMAAPIIAVMLSDLYLGVSPILLFTWSAWLVTVTAARLVPRFGTSRVVVASAALGVGTSTTFFLWTNFGVWAIGAGIYYPASWDGLLQSYIAGIPFYRTMLLGNLLLVTASVWIADRALRPSAALHRSLQPVKFA